MDGLAAHTIRRNQPLVGIVSNALSRVRISSPAYKKSPSFEGDFSFLVAMLYFGPRWKLR